MKGLGVGIDRDEVNPADFGINHVVDGVFAGAPDSHHFDSGKSLNFWIDFRHVGFRLTEKK